MRCFAFVVATKKVPSLKQLHFELFELFDNIVHNTEHLFLLKIELQLNFIPELFQNIEVRFTSIFRNITFIAHILLLLPLFFKFLHFVSLDNILAIADVLILQFKLILQKHHMGRTSISFELGLHTIIFTNSINLLNSTPILSTYLLTSDTTPTSSSSLPLIPPITPCTLTFTISISLFSNEQLEAISLGSSMRDVLREETKEDRTSWICEDSSINRVYWLHIYLICWGE